MNRPIIKLDMVSYLNVHKNLQKLNMLYYIMKTLIPLEIK